jgi:hypothetical protein
MFQGLPLYALNTDEDYAVVSRTDGLISTHNTGERAIRALRDFLFRDVNADAEIDRRTPDGWEVF